MTLFGFVIGSTLINTLFVFDLYVTKFQQKKSLWGSTMTVVADKYALLKLIPIYTVLMLWLVGLLCGNFITPIQVLVSIFFWLWLGVLYGSSTYYYYKWKIPDLENKDG